LSALDRLIEVTRPIRIGVGIREEKRINPGKDRPVGALLLSRIRLEKPRHDVEGEREERHAEQQARHADMLGGGVIVRQAVKIQQVKSTQQRDDHVHAEHKVVSEELGLRKVEQLKSAQEFDGRCQFQEAHDYLYGIHP